MMCLERDVVEGRKKKTLNRQTPTKKETRAEEGETAVDVRCVKGE